MRVPLGWLREYAPTDLGAEPLAEILIPRGVLIEAIRGMMSPERKRGEQPLVCAQG